jgi:glycosyltransferase involved in cell wall biosynthesis
MKRSVSVIVPTYARQSQVSAAIGSILGQSNVGNVHVQIVLVDDASPTPIDLHTFPDIQIVRHETNKGAAGARNSGIEAASGDLIAFLDSDDIWLANKLAHQLDLFDELSRTHDPNLLAVGAGFYDPDRRSGVLRARLPRDASAPELFASGCWFCPGSALIMSRKAFEIVGLQDEKMTRLEDLDWFIRFGQSGGKFFSTQSHEVVIRPSGHAPFDAVFAALLQLASKYGPSGTMPLPSPAWNRLAAYMSLEKAVAYFGNHRPIAAMLELAKTMARKPRLQPALEAFWDECPDVPEDVQQIFTKMKQAQE